jgi:hypothetical protein
MPRPVIDTQLTSEHTAGYWCYACFEAWLMSIVTAQPERG